MFIAALFIIAKKWKRHERPTDGNQWNIFINQWNIIYIFIQWNIIPL